MPLSPRISRRTGLLLSSVLACAPVVVAVAGCGSPNRANIDLRKQNAGLQSQIQQLKSDNAALRAQVQGVQATTVPSLSVDRLDNLFTVHSVEIHKLTSGSDLKNEGRGDTGIRLYIEPRDDRGNPIQATGHVTVDAFDLSRPDDPRIGHWEFGPQDCKNNWYGGLLRYSYIFECPWHRPPRQDEVTVRIKFVDELTHRVYTAERVVKVNPAPATGPTTGPTTDAISTSRS